MNEPAQLWNDERIREHLEEWERRGTPSRSHTTFAVLMDMRAEYETDRAALTARIVELEAENNQMYEQVRKLPIKWGLELGAMQTRIAELEAQLAHPPAMVGQRWEPVEDDFHEEVTTPDGRTEIDVIGDTLFLQYTEFDTGFHCKLHYDLATNLRLYRLTASPQPPAPQVTMPTPDWSQAPKWAMWWAMDGNGATFWHKHEPKKCGRDGWVGGGRSQLDQMPGQGWYRTLQQRPQNGGATHAE